MTTRSLVPGVRKATLSPTRALTPVEFYSLREVPAATEWFANLDNPRTKRAYEADLRDFMAFSGLTTPEQLREVTRAHVIAWRKTLEERSLSGATIRRKMAALSSLFEYLTEKNSVLINPVKGAKRPKVDSGEGKTPALGDHEARSLLDAPDGGTLIGKRDRAILSTLLYHALRREELCLLCVKDIHDRRGVKHLRVHGKGNKLRYVPLHPSTAQAIDAYLTHAGHGDDWDGALFRPTRNTVTKTLEKPLSSDAVLKLVKRYGEKIGLAKRDRFAPHALRATAATNALDHETDIAKVQEWLGHANISTTRIYDRRSVKPEESPTFRVRY